MSLMAIILWALHALSPWKRYYETARHLIEVLVRNLTDQATVDWLCANPDDPSGISHIERCIDDLNAGIDLLIHVRAREILGLRAGRFRRPALAPPQRRRSRTLTDLCARLRACALRFDDLERLAQRRAEKLKHLLNASETALGPPAHESIERRICLPLSHSDWGRWIARSCERDGGGSHAGTLGARAPPNCLLPTAHRLSRYRD